MATNGHSGYPLKWFVDQNAARDSWVCAICLEVLKDPVQVRDCGHQFCALCIDDILKTDPCCPSCRISISKAMVFEDHAARRFIKKMDVNCCNEGCIWVGNLSSLLETHMNSCNFLVNLVSNDSASKQSDVEELKAKLESLTIKVSTLKEMHQNELEELKVKHEADLNEIKIKHENDSKKRDEELKKLKDQISFYGTFTPVPSTSVQSLEQLKLNPTVTIALKIPDFTRKLNQAKSSNDYGRIDGEPFYTSHGYRLKVSVHLNEGPCGYIGYMGVYLILTPGDHDDNLEWPFSKKVTFVFVDQQDSGFQVNNFVITLTPDAAEAYNRPGFGNTDGRGFSQFMLHSTLRTRQYIKNSTVYIAVATEH